MRMRSEHAERTRPCGIWERAAALAAGGVHVYDPARPWNWAYGQLVNDPRFWEEEIEGHAAMVLA